MINKLGELKKFAMTNQLIEHDLDLLEDRFNLDLGRGHTGKIETNESYYLQIEEAIRREAATMAPHYEMFYSLEKTIRRLISAALEEEQKDWWDSTRIPKVIRDESEKRKHKEIDSGVTPRSSEPIDFCTFGELGEIIKNNWDIFAAFFSSIKAVEHVMSNLNTLRGPIAHCSPLAEDEIVRLKLTVKDWFRLME